MIRVFSPVSRGSVESPPFFQVLLSAATAPKRLQRELTAAQPNQVWGTDIPYIRAYESWLDLSVVIGLHSQAVVGWPMQSTMATKLVLDALMMAAGRRQPQTPVMIHSDQGSQFGSDEFLPSSPQAQSPRPVEPAGIRATSNRQLK
ncbi:hypothetical protein EXZ61_17140 [Rhodoferax aquaticus]|uniref:Integrase catalytic domain-containing protein n=1 Tax=Rhodoferax aquaticus TaxID=2527691 RepID=A0A515ESZ8_9BURK|nr:hypothetical protein EXZ61_17140 [Rhodoferax aquaticus]